MEYNFDNNFPIYLQLVECLKKAIIKGEYQNGDRLPSVRDLAIMFKINPNNVQRALNELEDLHLIHTCRTNGKFGTDNQELIEKYKKEYATALINNFLDNMDSIGFTKQEVLKYISECEKKKRSDKWN